MGHKNKPSKKAEQTNDYKPVSNGKNIHISWDCYKQDSLRKLP
jgi:hypothetical protein